RPALGAQLAARRLGSVLRLLALPAIEARHVAARERRPHHAVGGHVDAARAPGALGRYEDLGERGLGGVGPGDDADDVAGLVHAAEADSHRLAPDGIVHRARHDAVERGCQPRVALVALTVAVGVDDDGRPALRLRRVAGLE